MHLIVVYCIYSLITLIELDFNFNKKKIKKKTIQDFEKNNTSPTANVEGEAVAVLLLCLRNNIED